MEIRQILTVLINIILVIILSLVAISDVKSKLISQKFLITLLIGSVAYVNLNKEITYAGAITAMIFIFTTLSIVYYISQKSIGWGDVKLCTCIAPYLDVEGAFTMVFVSVAICGLISILFIATKRTKRNSEIPFAPFVMIGTLTALCL